MLLDEVMPRFDATRVEHLVVAAPPARVYAGALDVDFIQVWRESPALRVLFGLRGAPQAAARRLRRRPPAPDPDPMRLEEMPDHGDWVKLAEEPEREIVFGAIGRFWGREIAWERIEAGEFEGFDRPGYGRIACNISLRPYGEGRTQLSYEARTATTDEASRRRFRRYWLLVSPFVGVVMRAFLASVRRSAERG